MKEDLPSVGMLLKGYRESAGLTQEMLAELAGLSARGISDLERGVAHIPRPTTLARLARALHLAGPDLAQVELAARRQQSGVPAHAAAGTGPRLAAARVPLVGRRHELALLERHLAGEGAPVLFLAGEPGIGKSHLVSEAAARAMRAGWRVLSGGCSRGAGQGPYAPLLQAIRHYLDTSPPALRRSDLLGCAWLVRLLPELQADGIEPLPCWALSSEQERRLLFRAVARFLANIAGPAGTLLVLDDVHLAGADALELLTALVCTADPSLRVVAAYRDTDLGAGEPLARTLAELGRAGRARHHRLTPLAEQEVEHLLAALLEGVPGDRQALAARAAHRAGGIPFFLVSCVQALCLDGANAGEDCIPWDVEQSVRQRVALLPALAQEVVQVVALASGVQPLAVLVDVIGQPERAVLAALDATCQARLLTDGELGYHFVHELIREVVEAGLESGRRLALHRRIAESLEQQATTSGAELPLAALVYHFGRSSTQDKALHYLELAGDRACTQAALSAAEAYYSDLVHRLDGLGRLRESTRIREKLGGVRATMARYDAALRVLAEAALALDRAADLEGLGRVTAQMGHIHYLQGTMEEGLASLQPVLARLEAQGPSSALTLLYISLAELNLHAGHLAAVRQATEHATQIAQFVGNTRTVVHAESLRGATLFLMGQTEEAVQVLEATSRLAEAAGEQDGVVTVLYALSWIYEERGDLAWSRHYAERGLLVASRLGDPVLRAEGIIKLGVLAYWSGQLAEARSYYAQVKTIYDEISITPESCAAAALLFGLGRVSQVEGAWEDAIHYLEAASIIMAPQGKRSGLRHAQSLLAECEILAGHPEQACARLLPLLDRQGVEECVVTTAVLPVLAWGYVEVGEVDQAARTVETALRRARAEQFRRCLVDLLRVQALVALRQDNVAEAEHALQEGLSIARQIPHPYAEARLQQVYGELHGALGARGAAAERLREALAIFRWLGARKDAERIDHLLAVLG